MISTSELPPYSARATCRKCGHKDIATTHYAEGQRTIGDFFAPIRCERLERMCRRCRFSWAEQPVDYANGEEAR